MKNPEATQTTPPSVDYKRIAEEQLGEGVIYVPNEKQTLILCKKTETPATPALVNTLHFLVIDLKTAAVVYEDRLANAHVEWFAPLQLKISKIAGIVQANPAPQATYYLYDLEKKQQVPLTDTPEKY